MNRRRVALALFYVLFSIVAAAFFFREQLGLSNPAAAALQLLVLAFAILAVVLFVWVALRGQKSL
jgi:hypothetical protein